MKFYSQLSWWVTVSFLNSFRWMRESDIWGGRANWSYCKKKCHHGVHMLMNRMIHCLNFLKRNKLFPFKFGNNFWSIPFVNICLHWFMENVWWFLLIHMWIPVIGQAAGHDFYFKNQKRKTAQAYLLLIFTKTK
jgi:hypothetical protein